MNIFDKAVEIVNPSAALRRTQDRFKLQMIRSFQNSGYDESGASRNKNSMRGWLANSKTPQEDIDKNLPTLRQRSRSLYMSAPLAVSAIKTNRTNIVGQGLQLKSTIDGDYLGMSRQEKERWQKDAEREFALWADSKFCDSTRVNNFYEIQQVACMSWLMNGDACVLLEYDKPYKFYPYGLRIHLIEADRISTPHQTGNSVYLHATDPNTHNRIYNGVEVDDSGKIVAYHICSTYPNSTLRAEKKWTRVKAFGDKTGSPNVLMIYETERAEQYRGVPYLAPVIEALKQLTRYSEAEMMAAVINGFFTVFITSENGTSDIGFGGVVDDEDSVSSDPTSYELGPGMVNVLNPGEKVEIADAKRPSTNFDAFVTALAKYVGAALEIPVELLTKSFASSYSASRAALLEAWKAFRMKRTWLAADLCQPIYEIFLTEAIATGRLKAPGFFLDPMIKKAYCGAQWNGPSQGMIDPVKEVTAAEKRISVGLSTRQKETVELTGGDFEANIAQLAREGEMMKEAGLVSVQSAETITEKEKKKMEKKTNPARFTNAVPATASQANNKFWNFVDSGGDSAELQLFGTISSEEDWWSDDCVTYRNFINELKALGDKKNINVLIQSGGGDVFAANAIYTALIQSKATITATVIGLCASAATIILQAASTRRIAKNGVLMAHNPSVTLYGSYTSAELGKLAEVTDKVKESIMSVYRDRLGKTDDEIEELMNKESWYVGQEAIDNGFCDELIEDSFQNSYTDKNVLTANGIGYNFKNFVNTFAPDEVRKKVQNLSKTPQKETGTFSNTPTTQKGNSEMGMTPATAAPAIQDAAQLRTAYPDFVNQIVEEAIKAERDRLKDIDSIANGIPNDVLMKAKYEEPLSAADLALAQLRANNQAGQKTLNNLTDDLANSGAGSVGTVPNVGNDGGSQQKAEQREAKVGGLVNALKGDKRRGK